MLNMWVVLSLFWSKPGYQQIDGYHDRRSIKNQAMIDTVKVESSSNRDEIDKKWYTGPVRLHFEFQINWSLYAQIMDGSIFMKNHFVYDMDTNVHNSTRYSGWIRINSYGPMDTGWWMWIVAFVSYNSYRSNDIRMDTGIDSAICIWFQINQDSYRLRAALDGFEE